MDKTFEDTTLYRFVPCNGSFDKDGYLITGQTDKTGKTKPLLVKIDKPGNLIWVKEFEIRPSSLSGVGINCWESKYNDGYVMVCSDDKMIISAETLVIKVNYEGQIMWEQNSPGATNATVYMENGNIVCVGRSQQSVTCLKVFYHDIVKIDPEPATNPKKIALSQNYPNPFNVETVIEYQISKRVYVKVEIYSLIGEKVKTLFQGFQNPESYTLIWNGLNDSGQSVASGVYLYQLMTDQEIICRKLLFQK